MDLSSFLSFLPLDALLLCSAFLYWKVNRVSLKTIFPKKPWKNSIIQGILLAVTLLVVSLIFTGVLTYFGLDDSSKVGDALRGIRDISPWLIVYLLVVRVVAEEIFFRSFLTRELGVIPAAVVFGIAHAGYESMAQVSGAIILGLIIGYHFYKHQDVQATWLGHILYNSVILAALFIV